MVCGPPWDLDYLGPPIYSCNSLAILQYFGGENHLNFSSYLFLDFLCLPEHNFIWISLA